MANFKIDNNKNTTNKTEYRYSKNIIDDKNQSVDDQTILKGNYIGNDLPFTTNTSLNPWTTNELGKTVYSAGGSTKTSIGSIDNDSGDINKFMRALEAKHLDPILSESITYPSGNYISDSGIVLDLSYEPDMNQYKIDFPAVSLDQ